MKLVVMGTGYVGLVAGACFSDSGNDVVCVDINKNKVDELNKGMIPIFEPGLEELVVRNTKARRLTFSTDFIRAQKECDVIFIAVGTPSSKDGSLDLKYVFEAVKMIRESVQKETVIVLKSTVPVGTAAKVRELLNGLKFQCHVVSNPEFLKEGTAVNDFMRPERVVIGCNSEKAKEVMEELYAPYVRSGNPIYFMENESAELAKYAANAFLAMKISFINELAVLSERVGANVHEVRKVLVSDSRIGNKFLYPGCGYGGSCFPKDVLALIQLEKENNLNQELFNAVHQINERQKDILFEKIKKHYKDNIKDKTVAIWGLSFKPMTDDMREAPSVTLIHHLLENGVKVKAYDPIAVKEAKKFFGDRVEFFENAYSAVKGADSLAILTEWNEFRTPDFDKLKNELKDSAIFDGRNIYSPTAMEKKGFAYYCIGRRDPK